MKVEKKLISLFTFLQTLSQGVSSLVEFKMCESEFLWRNKLWGQEEGREGSREGREGEGEDNHAHFSMSHYFFVKRIYPGGGLLAFAQIKYQPTIKLH